MDLRLLCFRPPADLTKTLRVMKLTALIILVACLTASANGFSQITLSEKNAPLQQVLKKIERQSGYEFLCPLDLLQKAGTVSVNLQNATLEDAVKKVLDGKSLTYTISDRTIIIREKPATIPDNANIEEFIAPPPINISGRITDSTGQPLENVNVFVRGTSNSTQTDVEGFFQLRNVQDDAIIEISLVGYQSIIIPAIDKARFSNITMNLKPGNMSNVTVKGSTGYQVIDRNHPGSFTIINRELINRQTGADILSRIENLVAGTSFRNVNDGLLIRGRNSILSDVKPLIILDNFPYEGDISNINPNDIESITVLRDAAASALWGARSGNGVIVITSRKGISTKPKIEFNSNLIIRGKPRIMTNSMSSKDFIELEQFLYSNGFYNAFLNDPSRQGITPVIEILDRKSRGLITSDHANSEIERLKNIDVKDDLLKYFYQSSYNVQSHISVGGIGKFADYYFSAGFDKRRSELVGMDNSNRITLRMLNNLKFSSKFTIKIGVDYSISSTNSGNNLGALMRSGEKGLYPYADLVDSEGRALTFSGLLRQSYLDTAGNGRLRDWTNKPLDEIHQTKVKNEVSAINLNIGFNYSIFSFLKLSANYQYFASYAPGERIIREGSFQVRNSINNYSQISNGIVISNFPEGGIYSSGFSKTNSHQGRIQIDFFKTFSKKHKIVGSTGLEIREKKINGLSTGTLYGYNESINQIMSTTNTDYLTLFPMYYNAGESRRIPRNSDPFISNSVDRHFSQFLTSVYNYDNRITLSTSLRKDETNLFGVSANKKGSPLWSIGSAWTISNEKFYKLQLLPELRVRMSYGTNGNFNRSATAYPTGTYVSASLDFIRMNTPPNSKLKWEQLSTLNVGIDFSIKNKVDFTLEYFSRRQYDLISQVALDPTTGITTGGVRPVTASYTGNVASMKGNGYEVSLNIKLLDKKFKWNTNLIASYVNYKVLDYFLPLLKYGSYYSDGGSRISPIIGYPLYSIFSLPFAGLNPQTGMPRGYVGGDISEDYSTILNRTSFDSLKFHGSAQAPLHGSFRNTINVGKLEFSMMLSFRIGYYFVRPYYDYSTVPYTWTGSNDYTKRWINSGDELHTTLPAFIFPFNNIMSNYYRYSEASVYSGDNIRLEDMTIAYVLEKSKIKKLPVSQIRLYSATKFDLPIWISNAENIDPFYPTGDRPKPSFSIGMNVTF